MRPLVPRVLPWIPAMCRITCRWVRPVSPYRLICILRWVFLGPSSTWPVCRLPKPLLPSTTTKKSRSLTWPTSAWWVTSLRYCRRLVMRSRLVKADSYVYTSHRRRGSPVGRKHGLPSSPLRPNRCQPSRHQRLVLQLLNPRSNNLRNQRPALRHLFRLVRCKTLRCHDAGWKGGNHYRLLILQHLPPPLLLRRIQ